MTALSKEFRDRCEVIAIRCRMRLGLRAYDRLPANDLAHSYGVLVHRPEQLEMPGEIREFFLNREDWWGVLFPTEPPIIVYHPNQSPTRYESTVMHELAHLLLEHPPEQIYLAPDEESGRAFNPRIEAEAAYLGSCLQIPRRGLYWAIQRGMDNSEIACYFKASRALVQWRQNAVNSN